jgi:hypothetical protein
MFTKPIVYLLTLTCCLGCSATPLPRFTMTDLPSVAPSFDLDPLLPYHNQRIQIRGFWYPLNGDQGILAAQPHLKSCCLTPSSTIGRQLTVKPRTKREPWTVERAMTLEGIFKIEPLYDEEGRLIQYYVLEEADEVSSQSKSSTLLLVGLLIYWLWK